MSSVNSLKLFTMRQLYATKCASELYGIPKEKREGRYNATIEDDVLKIEDILAASGIFKNHNPTVMSSIFFGNALYLLSPSVQQGTKTEPQWSTTNGRMH